jgi:hypothetical protein
MRIGRDENKENLDLYQSKFRFSKNPKKKQKCPISIYLSEIKKRKMLMID